MENKVLRILHTDARKSGWGGENSRIFLLCRKLKERGHTVSIAAPGTGLLIKRAESFGINTWPNLFLKRGFHPFAVYMIAKALAQYINEHQVDIIHTHGSQDTWVSVLAVALARRGILIRTRHNTKPIANHFFNRKLYQQWSQQVVAVSEAVAEVICQAKLLPKEKIAVIPDAVDLEQFNPNREYRSFRQELGIPETVPVICDVARLSPRKGHDIFLKAAAEISKSFPETHFIIAGRGQNQEVNLKQQATDLGLANRLHLTGLIDDVPRLLADIDVFLHCSFAEALGTATIEALAMEKPVVATDVGGTRDIVINEKTGLLIPPHNPTAAAEAVLRILPDENLAKQLGKAGRKWVTEKFSPSSQAEQLETLYYSVLER